MRLLSPSILSADFTRLGEDIGKLDRAGAQYIHVDVMDGLFVPSISFGMPVLSAVRKITETFLDVHLMIVEPERYIEEFVKAGADGITIHLEACREVDKTIGRIHSFGVKAGISINPGTPVEQLLPYLEKVDLILLMSVNPGFGGQKYIESSTEKIVTVRKWLTERGLQTKLEVDGGINRENIEMVLQAGADVIVAGSSIFGAETEENALYFMECLKEMPAKAADRSL